MDARSFEGSRQRSSYLMDALNIILPICAKSPGGIGIWVHYGSLDDASLVSTRFLCKSVHVHSAKHHVLSHPTAPHSIRSFLY
jgi:hypothetical protein